MELSNTFFYHFAALEDPREHQHKVQHKLYDILAITILGAICGTDGWVELCEFAEAKEDWLITFLELPNGIPSHDTFSRVFSLMDPETFESCFISWIKSLSIDVKNEVISIDGKSLRGSHDKKKDKQMLHMVSAWASENKVMLGQVKTEDKSNEITAIPELLDMINVENSIVTIDAMGCQTAIAKKIKAKKADYVLSLKDNQPNLRKDVVSIFEQAKQSKYKKMLHKERVEKVNSHGRKEYRKYTLLMPRDQEPFALRWPHLSAIGMVEVERKTDDKKESSKRFFLTSLTDGYELLLMKDLPKGNIPEEGKIYVEPFGNQLRCVLLTSSSQVDVAVLNINIPNLNLKSLTKNRTKIIEHLGKRKYILKDQDIVKFMRAVRKHWNIEINLHWTLDVSFKEDLNRSRIGDSAENLSIVRRIALNLLKQEKTSKVGITARRKRAGWDNKYLLKVLMSDLNLKNK